MPISARPGLLDSRLPFAYLLPGGADMDTKAQKKVDVLNQRLQKLRLQLAGARKQQDEPDEVGRLETEVAQVEGEVKRLKET
jgi:hypothetical protein